MLSLAGAGAGTPTTGPTTGGKAAHNSSARQTTDGPIPSHVDSLASKLKIVLAEHSPTGLVHVEGARVCTARSLAELIALLDSGLKHRATSSTQVG